MPDEPNAFVDLMDRVAQDDQEAAAELVHEFGPALILIIRTRLNNNRRLRSIYDSDDIAQTVWSDFFAGPAKCNRFATPTDFLKYITGMTYNQVRKAARKHLATQKRNLLRCRHLSAPRVATTAETVADPSPTPVHRLASCEEWDRWLASMTSKQQRLLLMIRAGFSHQEIAARFDCSIRTIERLVDEIRNMPPPEPIANL